MTRPKFPDFCKKKIDIFTAITITGAILTVIKCEHHELAHMNQLCTDLADFNKTIRIVYEMWGDKLNTPHNLKIRKVGER